MLALECEPPTMLPYGTIILYSTMLSYGTMLPNDHPVSYSQAMPFYNSEP